MFVGEERLEQHSTIRALQNRFSQRFSRSRTWLKKKKKNYNNEALFACFGPQMKEKKKVYSLGTTCGLRELKINQKK
jgi:hypothetical protein